MMKRAFKASLVVSLLVLSTIVASVSPFLTLGAMGDAPSEVWVDDDFDSSTTGWGVTRFDSVQDGVDAVASGGTVHVNSGTYNERLHIVQKSLTLDGEDADTTVLQGDGSGYGVYASSAPGITIKDLWFTGHSVGVDLARCDSSTVEGSKFTENTYTGLDIFYSDLCTVTGNTVEDNTNHGIRIYYSDMCTLRDNEISGSMYNLRIEGHNDVYYVQDIDVSNTVDGDPIYYWVGRSNEEVPKDAGFVGLVDCDHITVKNLELSNNYHGVLLVRTRDSSIKNVEVTDCGYGLYMYSSEANTLWGNTFASGYRGIFTVHSPSNLMAGNSVSGFTQVGISIGWSGGCTLSNNIVEEIEGSGPSDGDGISVSRSDGCTLFNNRVEDNSGRGIRIYDCDSSSVTNNKVKGNGNGIRVDDSDHMTISSNKVRDNIGNGIRISDSGSSTLRENVMSGNLYNFGVDGSSLAEFTLDIDVSNTIGEKPIYYWVGRSYATIPSDAGYVCVVDSDHVTVKDLTLTKNAYGVTFAYTTDSTINNAKVEDIPTGIYLYASDSNTVTGCSVMEFDFGISISHSSLNTVVGNTVVSGDRGIYLYHSGSNDVIDNVVQGCFRGIELYSSGSATVSGNTVSGCTDGIYTYNAGSSSFTSNMVKDNSNGLYLYYSNSVVVQGNTFQNHAGYGVKLWIVNSATVKENVIRENGQGLYLLGDSNSIYYNDFIDNVQQLVCYSISINKQTWDDGSGMGNHWSDYAGEDTDDDGVGDTLLPHLGADNYPLMEPYN